MRHIKYPSIEQYRNTVRNVRSKGQFRGFNDLGEPVIDRNAALPTLIFRGTVKLHGTNAGVVFGPGGNMWAQSRENIITPEKDNAGFAMFAHKNMESFRKLESSLKKFRSDTADKVIVVFGEWCGQGIQKGVAISELPKMFVIFDIAVVDGDAREWLTSLEIVQHRGPFQCVYDFPTWKVEIDFENPEAYQNYLNQITESVEADCPAGRALGAPGVGEGVVWKCVTPGYEDPGFWFKVKGEKHSKSKVKTLATVNVERIHDARVLSERLANNERLEQMHQIVFDTLNGGETDISKMGSFIKAVMTDIFKEEIDLIAASGFTGKELNGPGCKICRDFIMNKLQF